jgi:hypothetical protein
LAWEEDVKNDFGENPLKINQECWAEYMRNGTFQLDFLPAHDECARSLSLGADQSGLNMYGFNQHVFDASVRSIPKAIFQHFNPNTDTLSIEDFPHSHLQEFTRYVDESTGQKLATVKI